MHPSTGIPTITPSADDHDDDHDDFGGMSRDLPRFLGRRRALTMIAGGALAAGLAACGSSSSDSSDTSAADTTSGGSSDTTGSGSDTTTGSTSSDGTTEVPEETAGPYPGDGSNGPDVLELSGVERQDIRSSFGDASGTAEGVELTMNLKLIDVAGGGGALAGAAVYLWHCTADGEYSMYTGNAANENYLRGVQVSDDDGNLSFTTIFPGAYSGRYPHMHFEVYASLDDAVAANQKLVTSQLAFPADTCTAVYETDGYGQSATNFPQTPIDRDGIFSDGYSSQMTTMSGDVTSGLVGTLNIGV